MSLNRVIQVAEGELGNTELPRGSNLTKYGLAYGWNGVPWCVIFLWWCFREARESEAFMGGGKTASCGELLRWYKAHGQVVPAKSVRRGDLVILNFSGTMDTQHCGFVKSDPQRGAYQTVEGNTSPGAEGSQDNGGCVALKTRYLSQIVGVCRPMYKAPKDYEGRWSEQDMRWADESGLIKGYEDGTFRPAQTMTREEVVALLHRYDAMKEAGKL